MLRQTLSRSAILVLSALPFSVGASAQDITATERDQALRYLGQTREGLVRAVKTLSEAQWNFKPSPDRWSAAEVLEHIAVTDEVVLKNVFPQLAQAKGPAADFDAKKIDAAILAQVPDRSTKLKAPEILVPTGRWTPNEALDHFLAANGELVSTLQANHELRAHIVPHPALGPLDGYEWILAAAAHTERHTKQILELEADPHFPAGPRVRNTN